MKQPTLLLLFFLSTYCGYSQASPHFSVNLQFLGNSYRGGINLQRDFVIDKNSHFSVGTGFGHGQNLIMTNQISYSTGLSKNFFEIGLTGSYSDLKTQDLFGQKGYLVMPIFGYKHISSEGFIARFHYSPVFLNGRLYNYGGMSIGLYLRNNKRDSPTINTIRFAKYGSTGNQLSD
jgi:hypothetical protein